MAVLKMREFILVFESMSDPPNTAQLAANTVYTYYYTVRNDGVGGDNHCTYLHTGVSVNVADATGNWSCEADTLTAWEDDPPDIFCGDGDQGTGADGIWRIDECRLFPVYAGPS